MSIEDQLQKASETVASWPAHKRKALSLQPSTTSAGSPQIPEILFDGYAVLKEVEARQNKLNPPMPTWEQVSIVLDAIVAIMKRR